MYIMEDTQSALHLAWAAGFFDGEGTIGIARRRGGLQHTLRLSIAQVKRLPMDKFVEVLGGRLYEYSPKSLKGKICHFWYAEAQKAEDILTVLLPYLVAKRKEAELALEFRATIPKKKGRHPAPSEEEIAQREEFRLQLVALHGNQGKNQTRSTS